jgi:hypothetical protein
METTWRQTGFVAEPGADGAMQNIGPLHTDGPDVERVREIVNRLVPPYLNPAAFRVYVVENPDWNAFACPNGMIVVYDSLLHAASDDEMAIILGHELTHVTHEHARKEFKDAMILQIIALGVEAAAAAVDSERAKAVIALASGFTLTAFKNGYGRDKEDQADRVGLRYAYEAGYDVRVGPPLWNRFAEKYGQSNALMNFFFGDHSRALDREKNLQREIAVNYASPVSATEAAGATLGSESTPPPTPPTKPTMPTLPTKPTMPTPPPKPTMTPTSGNLALHKSATQSSTYSPEYGAGVCVDGNRTGGWCHTNSEANPWWQVDLGGNYALSRIVVYNRADQWGAREHTIRALVSTDGRNWTTIYAHDGSDFQVLPIDAGNRIARYVRLQLAATDYLNLVEVEVYGTTPMECSTGLPNSKPGN